LATLASQLLASLSQVAALEALTGSHLWTVSRRPEKQASPRDLVVRLLALWISSVSAPLFGSQALLVSGAGLQTSFARGSGLAWNHLHLALARSEALEDMPSGFRARVPVHTVW